VFEPNTRSIGIPFLLDDDWDGLLRPTADNWQQTYLLYHEMVHFYQFHATSWGLLHQLLGRAEFHLLSGFLRAYADEEEDVGLPLLTYGASRPLTAFDQSDPRVLLRFTYLLDTLRRHIFGYEQAPTSPFVGEKEDEYLRLLEILYEVFGTPKIMVVKGEDFRRSDTRLPPVSLRIDDFLESHAHALSSLWMFQAVERFGLDPQIGKAVLRRANRAASGPYGSILDFAQELPIDDVYQLAMFSTICDLSLNALDPVWLLGQAASRGAVVHVMDHDLDPTRNCLQLISATIEGDLPVLHPGGAVRSMVDEYLDAVSSLTPTFDHLRNDVITTSAVMASPLVESLRPGEVLNYVTLDVLGTFLQAQQARRDHQPLLLGGVMIEDLLTLIDRVGVANFLSHVGDRASEAVPAFRGLTGLALLGNLGPEDVRSQSGRLNLDDIQIVSTLRDLLLMSSEELSAETVTFGTGSQLPSTVLARWWGLHPNDFAASFS
jgi:hypothetical protein